VVKYTEGRNAFTNDLEGYAHVDSDCEGNPSGASDGTSEEQNEEETRAVLTLGPFSACVNFLTSAIERVT